MSYAYGYDTLPQAEQKYTKHSSMACVCSLGQAIYYIWYSQELSEPAKFVKMGSWIRIFAITFFLGNQFQQLIHLCEGET